MGFALWIEGDIACAYGTHEYRPMGAAIIGVRGQFTQRDFRPQRRLPRRDSRAFAGYFASIGEMNEFLRRRLRGYRKRRTKRLMHLEQILR